MSELQVSQGMPSRITVAGIGGGGGNAVNHMYEQGISGVNFVVCNTDRQAVERSPIRHKIVLGPGLGAGNDPQRGHDLAVEAMDEIKECFSSLGTEMLFLTAGMGGGTGTGASPVIAQIAREMGILTVAIVTTPKSNEGPRRRRQAEEGIEKLMRYVDSILVIENDSIAKIYGKDAIYDGFRRADEILTKAAKGIAELITIPGEHNVDFADVYNVMRNSGRAHFSVATASGVNRINDIIEGSLHSPLMEKTIAGARDAIVNISASSFRGENAITQSELDDILDAIGDAAGFDSRGEEVNIIWGTTEKPELGDTLELVLVATRFDAKIEAANNADDGRPVVLNQNGHHNRYSDIESKLNIPAYQRRNFRMITDTAKGGETTRVKSSLKLDVAPEPMPQNTSLFGDETDN